MKRLWLIISVYTSTSRDEINTLLFKELCAETYLLILKKFNNTDIKCINISPTLLMLLAHSCEIIKANNNCSLEEYSESSIEYHNKVLHFFRLSLSRN